MNIATSAPLLKLSNNNRFSNSPLQKDDCRESSKLLNSRKGASQRLLASKTSSLYRSESLDLSFTNTDGDNVSISYKSVEMSQSTLSIAMDAGKREDWQAVVDKIYDEYKDLKQLLIDNFTKNLGIENLDKKVHDIDNSKIQGLPEYWNAENTSQRIVDFATSFYSVSESQGIEYYEMMKAAITTGFNEAMGELGNLPDNINSLSNSTFELAIAKLDEWAISKGIDISETVAA